VYPRMITLYEEGYQLCHQRDAEEDDKHPAQQLRQKSHVFHAVPLSETSIYTAKAFLSFMPVIKIVEIIRATTKVPFSVVKVKKSFLLGDNNGMILTNINYFVNECSLGQIS